MPSLPRVISTASQPSRSSSCRPAASSRARSWPIVTPSASSTSGSFGVTAVMPRKRSSAEARVDGDGDAPAAGERDGRAHQRLVEQAEAVVADQHAVDRPVVARAARAAPRAARRCAPAAGRSGRAARSAASSSARGRRGRASSPASRSRPRRRRRRWRCPSARSSARSARGRGRRGRATPKGSGRPPSVRMLWTALAPPPSRTSVVSCFRISTGASRLIRSTRP